MVQSPSQMLNRGSKLRDKSIINISGRLWRQRPFVCAILGAWCVILVESSLEGALGFDGESA